MGKMKSFVIDRSKWLHAGIITTPSDSCLLYSRERGKIFNKPELVGKSCCLGLRLLSLGVPEEILNVSYVRNLNISEIEIPEVEEFVSLCEKQNGKSEFDRVELTIALANDKIFENNKREVKIKELFAEYFDTEVTFVGEYE